MNRKHTIVLTTVETNKVTGWINFPEYGDEFPVYGKRETGKWVLFAGVSDEYNTDDDKSSTVQAAARKLAKLIGITEGTTAIGEGAAGEDKVYDIRTGREIKKTSVREIPITLAEYMAATPTEVDSKPVTEESEEESLSSLEMELLAEYDAPQESATEVDPSPAPRFSLPFEPAYYPNDDGGTDIRDGNGELQGWTVRTDHGSFRGYCASGELIATPLTDDEAIHIILCELGTPIEYEVTVPASSESQEPADVSFERRAAQRARLAAARAKREAREAESKESADAETFVPTHRVTWYVNADSTRKFEDVVLVSQDTHRDYGFLYGTARVISQTAEWQRQMFPWLGATNERTIDFGLSEALAIEPIQPAGEPRTSNLRPVTPAIAASRAARAERVAARGELPMGDPTLDTDDLAIDSAGESHTWSESQESADLKVIPPEYVSKVLDIVRTDHTLKVYPSSCKDTAALLEMNAWNAERGYPWLPFTNMTPKVVEIRTGLECDEDGSLWTVDVQYSTSGACAVYGVTPDGRISLYAN
jgi:hypothetical protein